MWLYNGRRITEGVAWSDDYGIQHPANWGLWSEAEKVEKGLVHVVQQQRPDERFYYIADNADGTFTAIPKDLQNLVSSYIFACKVFCNTILKDSDWQVIAFLERSRPIPAKISEYRRAVVKACNDLETMYNACTTIEELVVLVDKANSMWPLMDPKEESVVSE